MTRQLRLIGWWDGPESGDGWPDVCGFVSGEPPDEQTVAYLRSGTVWAAAAGVSLCRLCGRDNGSAELTDGVDFCWPEGLAHYVEEHGVRLPAEVRGRKEAPPVDLRGAEDALLTVDDSWWRLQGSEPATHRPGCGGC